MKLLRSRPVTGASIFDLQIIATMKVNKIHRIYTINTSDFKGFEELAVVEPQNISSHKPPAGPHS